METAAKSIMALDVGNRRIGVALADSLAKLAHPLTTIERSDDSPMLIKELSERYGVVKLIVGRPRGLSGQNTPQTEQTLQFVGQLKAQVKIPIELQDEALTSVLAEKELASRRSSYKKADIDALAATYILEDYLTSHPGDTHV
ncbi:MAG TPA: Holliday junction resolvase RuvX [Patescibacteria group bacterium]|jgi:putative Holliday junction resolvase|nr:Holliday junction resolvase RuvX [Patescibacteria group bacterium]